MRMRKRALEEYFDRLFPDRHVKVMRVAAITPKGEEIEDIKGYGYGRPLIVEIKIGDEARKFVLSTMRPDHFGHEHFSDRARILLWAHSSYNKLPRHVKSVDVGAFLKSGDLVSLGLAEEFFLVTEYMEGREYFMDLERIKETGKEENLDIERAKALSSYLAEIHSVRGGEKALYVRRIRELLGDGEQIMGLIDSYDPEADFLESGELMRIEKRCVEWRWKLKEKCYRICQVHGDFHPWNVKFRNGTDFVVFDRSRGEWGEAADDVSSMSINYLFYSLRTYGELKGPFLRLWSEFLNNYLDKTGDEEILQVIQPFFAWRGLVIANPIWYPTLSPEIRRKMFNFINNVLDSDVFDYRNVNGYLR